MKTRIVPLLLWLAAMLLLLGCGREATDSSKPQVIVSLYTLQDFAQKIGGNYIDVKNLVPPGTEPHDFDPSPQDIVKLNRADLFLYNGAGLETWVKQALPNIDQAKTLVVNTSDRLQQKQIKGQNDPHVWLNPDLAAQQAKAIYNALIQIDPKHKDTYTTNYQKLSNQFASLQKEYSVLLDTPIREFVTAHAAFSYLADRYQLKQVAIAGLNPEDEPSPKEVKQLVDQLRQQHIKVIFFETLANNKLAATVKQEIGAQALVLNPLEGLSKQEIAQGEDYFSVMRSNLTHLKKALGVDYE